MPVRSTRDNETWIYTGSKTALYLRFGHCFADVSTVEGRRTNIYGFKSNYPAGSIGIFKLGKSYIIYWRPKKLCKRTDS